MIPAKIKKSKWHLATVERNRTVSVGWKSRLSLLVCDSKPATLVNDLNSELSWTWVQIPPPPPFYELLNNMKRLLENWRKLVREGEVLQFPHHPKISEANLKFVIMVENSISRRLEEIYGNTSEIPIEKLDILEDLVNELERLLQE